MTSRRITGRWVAKRSGLCGQSAAVCARVTYSRRSASKVPREAFSGPSTRYMRPRLSVMPVWDVVEATGIEPRMLRAYVANHALQCMSWQIHHQTDDVPRQLDRAERVLDRYGA